jgi:glycosyltransferase involved in cell wall biosynthesis
MHFHSVNERRRDKLPTAVLGAGNELSEGTRMRIAQVAPLFESIPPKLYGGTERVVSYLTEELVRQGHDVTLFASGDSVTTANLIPVCSRALRLETKNAVDPLAHYVRMLELVFRDTRNFDIMHFHIDYFHFPLTRRQPIAAVTTLHGRLDLSGLPAVYRESFERHAETVGFDILRRTGPLEIIASR